MSFKRSFLRFLRGWWPEKVEPNGRLRYPQRTFSLIATVGTIVTLFTFQSVFLPGSFPPPPPPPVPTALVYQRVVVDSEGDTGRSSSLALDASGNPHISYFYYGDPADTADNCTCDLRYAKWNGSAWRLETVDSEGRMFTFLALDASGDPHISYYDRTNLTYARKSGGVWTIEKVDSTPWTSFSDGATSLALDTSGNPHISYHDTTNHDLRYATKTGGTWTLETVDSVAGNNQSPLVLDASGNPHISYWWNLGGTFDLKYAVRVGSGGNCLVNSAWNCEIVDSATVGRYSSLALDASGNPHISYLNEEWDELKYAWKSAGVWSVETVDSSGFVGFYTSLALDSSGNPHISYFDYSNEDLRYASRNGGVWTVETVDSLGSTGWETSLALDSSGAPHISYFDDTNADLRYAFLDIAPPSTPAFLSPTDGSTTTDNTLRLDWSDVSDLNRVTYTLQVDNSPGFTSPEIEVTGLSTSEYATTTSLPGGTYYWRVRATDEAGNNGAYSSVRTLAVNTSSPTSIAPVPIILATLPALAVPMLRRRRPR